VLKHLEKEKPWKVGLLQALGVAIYCGLVAAFMFNIQQIIPGRPGIAGVFLMLSLLVFSAAITGSLIFAYPIYLAVIKNKLQEAFTVLAFTLVFSLIFIVSTILYIIGIFA
jgi:hypothetical protein